MGKSLKISVIGLGATGSVIAAALIKQDPETVCVDPKPGLGDLLIKNGIAVSGALEIKTPVKRFYPNIMDLRDNKPDVIIISTKTYHLENVLKDLKEIFVPGMKIISSHNGLGTEDVIAEEFGSDAVFRMSLSFGASLISPGRINVNFFDKPNYIGCLERDNKGTGEKITGLLTAGGLDTMFVDDIKFYVWRKMIGKCSNAPVCAITGMTIKDILNNPNTREIATGCYREALAVSNAMGYVFDENYTNDIIEHMAEIGTHRDSMHYDIENKLPTEIDFLGGKIVEYAHARGIPVPFFEIMTNLIRGMESSKNNQD
ncbi:MAG: 2-dehydropantoate 2-reductase [Spirochaetes bacterium]|nr:2-dehydropantoate 2-reductase [Spirochaetota bacterium]